MTAQQLVDTLQSIIRSHGPDIAIESRNVAGDMDSLEEENVQLGVGWTGVSVVFIDPSSD